MSKMIKAYTLMEIVIVIIIVGLIAAFALPNYAKSIRKADERTAIVNLMAIRAAAQFYLMNTGDANIQNWADTNAVNTALGLSIIDPKLAYSCAAADSTCSSVHPGGWTLRFHLTGSAHNTDGSIHCLDATCPSCPQGGAGDCG